MHPDSQINRCLKAGATALLDTSATPWFASSNGDLADGQPQKCCGNDAFLEQFELQRDDFFKVDKYLRTTHLFKACLEDLINSGAMKRSTSRGRMHAVVGTRQTKNPLTVPITPEGALNAAL